MSIKDRSPLEDVLPAVVKAAVEAAVKPALEKVIPPVARITDKTAHGGTIVKGITSVLVKNVPIAVVTSEVVYQVSHASTVVVPPCSTNVLIDNKPVARIGDMASCCHPDHDVIVASESTVTDLIIGGAAPLLTAMSTAPTAKELLGRAKAAAVGIGLGQLTRSPLFDALRPVAASVLSMMRQGKGKPSAPGEGVLGPDDLDAETEMALLEANGGKGMLLPYKSDDPEKEAVVFVHAFGVGSQGQGALMDVYANDPRYQTYNFVYNAMGQPVDESASQLAEMLKGLPASQRQKGVRLIAHSVGGAVSRCALNSLAYPDWYEVEDGNYGAPSPDAAQFARIDLATVDTGWQGYKGPPGKFIWRILRWGSSASWPDMIATSDMMERIHRPPLPGNFSVSYIEADQRDVAPEVEEQLHHPSVHELSDEQADAVVDALNKGDRQAALEDPAVRNTLATLAAEKDFPRFADELYGSGMLTRERFREIVGEMVPTVPGTHHGMVSDPEKAAQVAEAIELSFKR